MREHTRNEAGVACYYHIAQMNSKLRETDV